MGEQEEILNIEYIMDKTYNFNEESEESAREEEDLGEIKSSLDENEYEFEEEEEEEEEDEEEKKKISLLKFHEMMRQNSYSSEKVLSTYYYENSESSKEVDSEIQVDEREYKDGYLDTFFSPSPSFVPISYEEERSEEEEMDTEFSEVDDMFTEQILVRFTTPEGEKMTCKFKVTSSILKVKKRIAKVFKIEPDCFLLSYDGEKCKNDALLSDYTVASTDFLELGIDSVSPEDYLTPGNLSTYYPLFYRMKVRIPRDVGGYKEVSILVENHAYVKEWLGGYRNRKTNLEYHHAMMQTLPRKRDATLPPLNSRQTQTPVFPLQEIALDTGKNKATQMWRTDHYVETIHDKLLSADPDRFKSKLKHTYFPTLVMIIVLGRRCCRRFVKAQSERSALQKQLNCLRIRQDNKTKTEEGILRRNKVLIRESALPFTRDDFYYLYLVIGKWWRAEVSKIKQLKTGSARSAAYKILLEKEIKFMNIIERKRIQAKKELLRKQDMYFLEACARPVIFCNNRGTMSSLDTLATQQARELLEIVSSYLTTDTSVKHRIGIIRTLINQIISLDFYECSAEIVDLLDRECDLMTHGIAIKHLKYLQDRILQLIMHYLHYYIVNPSCKNYKKPSYPRYDQKLYLCKQCGKLKHVSDYNVHVVLKSFEICMSCEWMKNVGQERVNLTPFARILGYVRESEMMKCCYSSVCYVLQTVGLHHLVTRIWLCKSILSDKKDLNTLRMVRFRKEEDWSPWNCILLTEEESIAHAAIDDVYSFYSDKLLKTIEWRHLKARNHFLPLLLNDRFMRETKLWFNVQDRGKFLMATHINEFAQLDDFEII